MLVLCSLVTMAMAQKENANEYKTIFGDHKPSVSGITAFNMEFSSLNGTYALQTGASMGVLLDRKLILGGFLKGANVDQEFTIDNISYPDNGMLATGLWLGYIFLPSLSVHPVVSVQSGWGRVKYENDYDYQSDYTFVVSPKVEIDLNITSFFRIAFGANYTFTTDVNKFTEVEDKDFSGPGGSLSFKFGYFK